MKKVIFILIYLSLTISAFSLASSKKVSSSTQSLEEWMIEQKNTLPETVDGIFMYRPDYDGEKLSVSDILEPSLDTEAIFVNVLLWIIDNKNPLNDKIASLDTASKRVMITRKKVAKEESDNSYDFDIALQAGDQLLSFFVSDIKVNYKLKGLIPKASALEKLNPQEKEVDRAMIEELSWLVSDFINSVRIAINENQAMAVTHWNEIQKGEVVKGMNYTEVKLAAGKPHSERASSNNKIKWMFDNNMVVIFENAVVCNVVK